MRQLANAAATALLLTLVPLHTPAQSLAKETEQAAYEVNAASSTVIAVQIPDDAIDRYERLAQRIGLTYGVEYSYSEWAEIKRRNDVGVAGEYEWLRCSTGKLEANELCPGDDPGSVRMYWESMYYSNHDLTVLFRVRDQGDYSFVRLLKLAKGRVPDIHNR